MSSRGNWKPTEGESEQDKRKLEKFTVLANLVAVVEGEVKYVQNVIIDPDKKGEVTNLDGGFKTGLQDWTTRKCGKVDLSMWIFWLIKDWVLSARFM